MGSKDGEVGVKVSQRDYQYNEVEGEKEIGSASKTKGAEGRETRRASTRSEKESGVQ